MGVRRGGGGGNERGRERGRLVLDGYVCIQVCVCVYVCVCVSYPGGR